MEFASAHTTEQAEEFFLCPPGEEHYGKHDQCAYAHEAQFLQQVAALHHLKPELPNTVGQHHFFYFPTYVMTLVWMRVVHFLLLFHIIGDGTWRNFSSPL